MQDNKRGMVIWLAEPAMQNQAIIDTVLCEVIRIEDEIDLNVEELNSLVATPKKTIACLLIDFLFVSIIIS